MDHLKLKPLPKTRRQNRPQHQSFRERGYQFLKKAGTNRQTLSLSYMWQSQRDWLRYGLSSAARCLPFLVPRPQNEPDRFVYAPPVEDADDFSFILVGDTGMNSPGEYLVTTALSRQDIYPSHFCLILGDVIYPAGGEECYRYGLLEAFKYYKKPVLAIPGNHDWYDNLSAFRKFFIKNSKRLLMANPSQWCSPNRPNWYFYMDFGQSLRIICLDTGYFGQLDRNRELQLTWLDTLLETAGPRKVLLMMHHPFYSLNQRVHEEQLKAILEPKLAKANVVGIFSGHDHNYQRHTIDGRQHIIQGAGGASLHHLPAARKIRTHQGKSAILTRRNSSDKDFSFIHCHWHKNQLTCTTVSAHQIPGQILDRFVL